jgi:Methylamine utilisation protein MauE
MEVLFNVTVYFLFCMLVVSSIPKIMNIKHFINLVKEYDFLPPTVLKIYGVILPFAELACAILLLIKGTTLYAAAIIITLLFSFLIGVLYMLNSDKIITCGCYGKFLDAKVSPFTVGKIVILMVASLIIIYFSKETNLETTFLPIVSGALLTILLLASEMVWSKHKHATEILN